MRIESEKIILRNLIISDIEDIIYWNTEATEWMKWDAPWERDENKKIDWIQYKLQKEQEILTQQDTELQMRLEVCIHDDEETHIGAISCYFIDEQYRINDNGQMIAIGMDIFENQYRKNGYGKKSYQMYIEYLKTFGYDTIYTQTWSGNIPLIKMAEGLGFKECNRYKGIRQVRGKIYDGLTFQLKL